MCTPLGTLCLIFIPFPCQCRTYWSVPVLRHLSTACATSLEQRPMKFYDLLWSSSLVQTINILCNKRQFSAIQLQILLKFCQCQMSLKNENYYLYVLNLKSKWIFILLYNKGRKPSSVLILRMFRKRCFHFKFRILNQFYSSPILINLSP